MPGNTTLLQKIGRLMAPPRARLKSGAESTVSGWLPVGRAEIFALPDVRPLHPPSQPDRFKPADVDKTQNVEPKTYNVKPITYNPTCPPDECRTTSVVSNLIISAGSSGWLRRSSTACIAR